MKNPRGDSAVLWDVAGRIVAREGGFSNHPQDRGGPTKYGITQRTLSDVLGRRASAADVAKLPEDVARAIYVQNYVSPFAFLQDPRLLDLVSDAAVQHGQPDAIRMVQRALGVKADGRMGQQTFDAAAQADPAAIYDAVLEQRARKYAALGRKQPVFKKGWYKRLEEFL